MIHFPFYLLQIYNSHCFHKPNNETYYKINLLPYHIVYNQRLNQSIYVGIGSQNHSRAIHDEIQ